MSMTDPLGDMLTRIRNAGMRRKSKVSTPGSKIRSNVLDVLQQEGYIRGYATTEFGNGRTEFEIELKYFDGHPVIREIERVSKPGRRVYAAVVSALAIAAYSGTACAQQYYRVLHCWRSLQWLSHVVSFCRTTGQPDFDRRNSMGRWIRDC